MKRRSFMQGCCGGLFATSSVQVGRLVFGQAPPGQSRDILIYVFLRGGMDALNFLVPYDDSDYHVARSDLRLRASQVLDINGQFGLHPSAAPLKELYDNGHLALVMACGSPDPSRSHFEAQDQIERGVPGDSFFLGGGWLGRYLTLHPSNSIFQGISRGSSLALSLEGAPNALALNGPDGFTLRGSSSQQDDLRRALRDMYPPGDDLGRLAHETLDATDIIEFANPGQYVPGNGVTYPNTSQARAMSSVAALIRLDLGLQAATIDIGGWDTHESQAGSNPTTGRFADLVRDLSGALHAFWSDLADFHGRITVMVQSEFGRRVRENNNRGTDHGRAGVMMVFSSDLLPGGLWGSWPGLSNEQLFESVDLRVTTDFRDVLGEVLVARAANSDLYTIFPGHTFTPVGFFGAQPQTTPTPTPTPRPNAVAPGAWSRYR